MKKVLIVCDYFPPDIKGGAEISTYELALHLSTQYSVEVFTSSMDKNSCLSTQTYENLTVHRLYTRDYKFLKNYAAVLRIGVLWEFFVFLNDKTYDIIHFNNLSHKLSFGIVLVPLLRKIPSLITFRDATSIVNGKFKEGLETNNFKVSFVTELCRNKFTFNPFRNILIRYLVNRVNYRIALSSLLSNLLLKNGINVNEVYHNRIFLEKYESVEQRVSNNILFVGRPSEDKGFFDLIKVMKVVHGQTGFVLDIIGFSRDDLPLHTNVYIEENCLDRMLRFERWIPQDLVIKKISEASIVVFPSKYLDAFGRVVLEALLCRTPIIVSRFAGASELVKDEFLVFDPFKEGDLEAKLLYVIKNYESLTGNLQSFEGLDNYRLSPDNDYYTGIYKQLTDVEFN